MVRADTVRARHTVYLGGSARRVCPAEIFPTKTLCMLYGERERERGRKGEQ